MKIDIHILKLGGVNCYLLQSEKCILIDAGMPGFKRRLLQQIRKTGTSLGQVKLLILTHGHLDHIGCAGFIKEETIAKIAIHHLDQPWLENGVSPIPPGRTTIGKFVNAFGRLVPEISINPTKADIVIGNNGLSLHPYGIPGTVIHTPGHTSGSISVILESGEAFVGDLVTGPRLFRSKPDLSFFAEDEEMLRASLKNLINMGVKEIYPAHGKPFFAEAFRNEL